MKLLSTAAILLFAVMTASAQDARAFAESAQKKINLAML
jgi:hypothetical protein